MRVLIVDAQVPYAWGGAELLASGLKNAILNAGHEVEIVSIPFKWYPAERIPEHMVACRLLDLTEVQGRSVDRLIGLRFPSYLVPHASKRLWIVHQHREAYDHWDRQAGVIRQSPDGLRIRDLIRSADKRAVRESECCYTISRNVSDRLRHYCGMQSTPLYPPVSDAEHFYADDYGDYVFLPSRIGPSKRQEMAIRAIGKLQAPVGLKLAGVPDHPDHQKKLERLTHELGVGTRVEFLGRISDTEKYKLYANALAVLFPPLDEDYGYVTLEAMLSERPVITCTDSGGPLEFVRDRETGLVVEPTPDAIADAIGELWDDRRLASAWGAEGLTCFRRLKIDWSTVISHLCE